MDRKQYDQIRSTADFIANSLKNDKLSTEERKELETTLNQMSGYLCSPWLPVGISRKVIMLALLLIGIYGITISQHMLAVCWLLIPLFSPRLMGEILRIVGKIKSTIK